MTEYISIKQVLDNCLHHPLLKDLTLERAVVYALDFIRLMGMPSIFTEKTADIEIKDYRGALPCGFHQMIQVRETGHHDHCHDVHHNRTFRYSTDNFHMTEHKGHHHHEDHSDLTYKIQGMVIFTSMKKGRIEISYRAIAVDSEGYPLIPDRSPFTRALELYIKKQCFTILFDLGKIQQAVLQNTQQEYAFYAGQAQSDLIMPTTDEMESIVNSLTTLLPRVNEHSRGFRTDGKKEKIKLH